ncbi:membrane dipeptidase [Streptomyces sp. MUM 178J]|uniref:membrane dipeptidase n=1 Tax=Streptomyces sp. MUM 178J TaxID=2791991 RepID=UPI001F043120|nr:membrane dipeptidase [Streptomyces sp. MUM 178J]WRQ79722.1 membrane dipeptidase [Streptomyces sp. MUM 178J]
MSRSTVALSGAFDTGSPHAPGLKDVSCFPRLIAELLDRNWPEADIAAITWENTLRELRAAELAARRLTGAPGAPLRRGPSPVWPPPRGGYGPASGRRRCASHSGRARG